VPRLYVEDTLRIVEAQLDYTPESSNRLWFLKGDLLDILVEYKDKTWLYARKGTVGGSVLPWYVTPPLQSVEAQVDYTAKEADELSFSKGDLLDILLDEKGNSWLFARKGTTGGNVLRWCVTPPLRSVEAKYDFTAKEADNLSYLKGDIIDILSEWESGDWLMARKGKNQGLVAKSYMERTVLKKVKATSEWVAKSSDELSFKQGDIMEVFDEREGNAFFSGRKGDKEGLVRKDCATSA